MKYKGCLYTSGKLCILQNLTPFRNLRGKKYEEDRQSLQFQTFHFSDFVHGNLSSNPVEYSENSLKMKYSLFAFFTAVHVVS